MAAKEAGGVDKLIEQIEKGAVSKAAPRIRMQGAFVGALGTAAVTGMGVWLCSCSATALVRDCRPHL
jgi:hypothetical protein